MINPRVEIAPGADPAASPSTFAWESAGRRRARVDIVTTAGRDDEASATEAGSMSATFDDRDGNLSPRNILGKWYGRLSNGTPARVVLDRVSDDMTRSAPVASGFGTGAQGFTWSPILGAVALSNDGTKAIYSGSGTNTASMALLPDAGSPDVEVTFSTTIPALPTGDVFRSGVMLRYTDDNNYIRAFIEFRTDGAITAWAQRRYGGATQATLSSTATGVTYVAGDTVHAKFRADGPAVMIKAWKGSLTADEPASWQASYLDEALDAAAIGLMFWRPNSDPGNFTVYVDNFTVTNILWQGAVPEWPKRWPDKSGADSITPISAAGILRRLGQGKKTLDSPLLHQLRGQNPFSYYPLEDGSGATAASSALSGQAPAVVNDVTFANDSSLPGASTTAVLNTIGASTISASVKQVTTPDGYAVMWFAKLESLTGTATPFMEIRTTGTITRWLIYLDGQAVGIRGSDRDGTLIVDSVGFTTSVLTNWCAFQLEVNASGSTISWAMIDHEVGSGAFFAGSGSYTGTVGAVSTFTLSAVTPNMAAGHIWVGDNDLPFVNPSFALVADGYRGEQAGDRIRRLCAENGVPAWVLTGATEPMGRQRPMRLPELLRECEAADQGLLYERGLAIAYIPRSRRYNIAPQMALSWPGLFDEPPEPQDDDQRLRNQWTVTRTDGGSVTVEDDDSIELDGLYDDSIELNIETDSRLDDFAGWLLSQSASKDLRWPRITISLMAHPELIGAWLGVRIGSRITISDPPAQIAGESIDLIVEGINQTLNLYRWDVELSCVPATPWQLGTYDDTTRRYAATATLALSSTQSARLVLAAADSRYGFFSWQAVPYEVEIAGQRNRVIGASMPDSVALADGTFEAYTASVWRADGASTANPVQTAAGAGHRGDYAVSITVAGSPSIASIRQATAVSPAAAAGQQHVVRGWVKCSTARNVDMCVDYYNGATFLSRQSASVAVVANTWTEIVSATFTAPASTTRIEYGPSLLSSPANGTVLTLDDLDIIRTDLPNSRQLFALTRAVDGYPKALPSGSAMSVAQPKRYGI